MLPQDITRQVNNEQVLIQNGIHSRRRAMDELGVRDPDSEFGLWLEERETILKMNRQLNARPASHEKRERAVTARRRVLGFALVYNPRRGEYRQRLQTGAV